MTHLSATLEPFLHVVAGEDFIVVDLVPSPHHGVQWCLAVLLQNISPQHKLRHSEPGRIWGLFRVKWG